MTFRRLPAIGFFRSAPRIIPIGKYCFVALAAIVLQGCQQQIQLPPSGEFVRDSGPVITLQNIPLIGTVNVESLSNAGIFVSPANVVVSASTTQALYDIAQLQLTVSATDQVLGVSSLRLQLVYGTQTIFDYTTQQFPGPGNKVNPTLGIAGTDTSGNNPGYNKALSFFLPSAGEVYTLTAVATNFRGKVTTIVANYSCPKCYNGMGGPSYPVGPSSGSTAASSCTAPLVGAFTEVQPNFNAVGQTLTSPNHLWSALIQATDQANHADPFAVKFTSGNQTYTVPFTVGTLAGLSPVGGVGFSGDSSKAVVATFASSMNMPVAFQIVDKATIFGNPPSTTFSSIDVSEANPVPLAGAAPELVQPRIFFSQDATFALTLSAPDGGSATSRFWLAVYDLRSALPRPLIQSGNISSNFASAYLSGCQIQVNLVNPTATVTFPIPN